MADRPDAVEVLVGLVWNRAERRPRAPWRILAQFVLFGLLAVALFTVGRPAVAAARAAGLLAAVPAFGVLLANVLASAVLIVGSVLLAVRYVDRRRLADLGLGLDRAWWLDLGFGLALGAAMMTGIFLVEWAVGWVRVTGVGRGGALPLVGALLGGAVLMVLVGVYEELLFRGYYLTNVAEGLVALPGVDRRRAIVGATALTAVVFGAVHAANPNATLASTGYVVVYGGYLALGYLLTGELAIPIGIHVTWNYVQAFVFGFPTSGVRVDTSLLRVTQTGPSFLTGGAFGPEAGLVGLAWAALSVPVVLWWVRRRRGSLAVRTDIAVPELRR